MTHLHLPLDHLPSNVNRLYVAFSGGIDSSVLLHRLLEYKQQYQLVLWHVNHGLQQNAAQMERFAQTQAQRYQLECRIDQLSLSPQAGNLEANARRERYRIFSTGLTPCDALLTAHHMNDQAETLLLNMMRGSGVAGLRAIALQKQLGQGVLLRPFLNTTRRSIENYAEQHRLEWVEDPSNRVLHFDRNYIRHQVIPVLEKRWPAVIPQLHRVCEWQNESHELLRDLAQIDYQKCRQSRDYSVYECLSVQPMLALSDARSKNLIRYWLKLHGKAVLGYKSIKQLLSQIATTQAAMPVVAGDDYSVRRFQGALYIVDNRPNDTLKSCYIMRADEILEIPAIGFRQTRVSLLQKLKMQDKGQEIRIRFRAGSSGISAHSHRLKRLFQKHRVPPWRREITPQILLDEELVALWLF